VSYGVGCSSAAIESPLAEGLGEQWRLLLTFNPPLLLLLLKFDPKRLRCASSSGQRGLPHLR